ncbi:MAG: heavy-metal-associated domain-containing protein [Tabrizicola sp.]
MKPLSIPAFLAAFTAFSALPLAATAQSATEAAPTLAEVAFQVPGMTCALCPLTVRKAMGAVPGVQSVEVDFAARRARVVYDPALTDAATIATASADAGYPALVEDQTPTASP